MPCHVGSLVFDDWYSLHLGENYWTDTFVYRIAYNAGIPPGDYARAIRRTALPLRALRSSASLWVAVDMPEKGTWFARHLRSTLRGMRIPFAVTAGMDRPPGFRDFSYMPWVDNAPSPPPPQAERKIPADVTESEIRCLQVLARLEYAYTREIAALTGYSLPTVRKSLAALCEQGYVEYHPEAFAPYPLWVVKRKGVMLALRSWGVSKGVPFPRRKERRSGGKSKGNDKYLYDGGRHIVTARVWPAWLKKAWGKNVKVWTGWSEVYLGGHQLGKTWRARPDAVAWGLLNGRETLFWLEVESGNRSKKELARKTLNTINKALVYIAPYDGVDIVLAVLAAPWVLNGIQDWLPESIPKRIAVVLSTWVQFGKLPEPVPGKITR